MRRLLNQLRAELFTDRLGAGLHKHCNEEMGYLAAFLPALHARETGAGAPAR